MDLTDILRASCIASLLLLGQGCGGGGSSDEPAENTDPVDSNNPGDNSSNTYSGSESQAVVSETNANDLAITATSGVKRAVDENDIVLPSQPAARALNSTTTLAPLDAMDDETTAAICVHGGRATVEYIETDPGYINIFDFIDCSYGEGLLQYTYTGSVHATYADDSDASAFTMVYNGLLTTVDSATQALNRTFSCEANFQNCNFYSDYSGYDGRLYRVTDAAVTEEGHSAYTASGRIYDPNHGYIDVTTEIPFTLECQNGRPGVGRLSFIGANQTSGSIEFISCNEYVVTTGGGVSNTYRW